MKTTIKTCTHCQAEFESAATHICSTPDVPDDLAALPQPHVGMVIDKKYRLENKLGEGGMGSVFRARRLLIDDFVAIKFMRPEVMADSDIRQRFYQEAQVAARIKHPNVVTVYDFGETAEGLVYLVMEFLEGMSLGQLINKKGPLALNHVIDIGVQICEALSCMHENNVIHRDLKPDNIMLVRDAYGVEIVKLVDFGVAKILESNARLTRFKVRLGSPVYSSPEQFLGKYVDHRTDLYGLGVIFYECLSGQVPFETLSESELLATIVHKMPPRLDEKIPGLTRLMADLVHWLLAKNPDDRPHNAAEVGKCLHILRQGKKNLVAFPPHNKKKTSEPESPFAFLEEATPEPTSLRERSISPMIFDERTQDDSYNEPIWHAQPAVAEINFNRSASIEGFSFPEQNLDYGIKPRRSRRGRKNRRRNTSLLLAAMGATTVFLAWQILNDPLAQAHFSQFVQPMLRSLKAWWEARQTFFPNALAKVKGGASIRQSHAIASSPVSNKAVQELPRSLQTTPPVPSRAIEEPLRVSPVTAMAEQPTPPLQFPVAVNLRRAEPALSPLENSNRGANGFIPNQSKGTVHNGALQRKETKKKNGAEPEPGAPPNSTASTTPMTAIPMDMVSINATSFQRGDILGDGNPNEQPAQWVRVGDFLIGKYEVTNKAYMAFVEATGSHFPEWMEPNGKYHYQTGSDDFYKKLGDALWLPEYPVVGVS
ncbi:MAG: protein kinase, partial [candidate division KSB1 bacterium]|nr:protein kinase [candidate division KSB1 bacterium]